MFWQDDCVVLHLCINTSPSVVQRNAPLMCYCVDEFILSTAKETRQQRAQEGNLSKWSRSTEKSVWSFPYRDCTHMDRQTRLFTVPLPPFPTAIQQWVEDKMTRVP